MGVIMRWVQLSDIHFQTKMSTYNTKQLRDKLPDYLKKMGGDYDALLVTGDYRYAPEGEENPTKVVAYIMELASSLKLNAKNIITVPGNHDLTRNGVRKAVILGVRTDYRPEEGTLETSILDELQKGFVFYEQLHEQLGDAPEWNKNPHSVVEMGGCNFLLLNTALTAGTDEDEHNLVLGSSYLDAAVSSIKNDKPIIAIGHHGFEFLKHEERKTCENYFEQHGIRLYLCGHTHDSWFSAFGESGKQVNSGCMKQEDNSVYAGFSVGELYDDGTVKIECHKWDISNNDWFPDMAYRKEYSGLYGNIEVLVDDCDSETSKPEKTENPLSICGYKLLGGLGADGIKYIWKKKDHFIESLAFNRRLKMESSVPEDALTSAYTISTSIGCELSIRGMQCKFCETGANKFVGHLKAEDIALQCIFMAKYDSNCPSYPQVRNNMREFAFMGQGEPGYNYLAIRQAIMLTDYAMETIDQKVSRYIISSCGIVDFMPALIQDIKNKVFKNKVTVHFSLHTINEERNTLMPINGESDYHEFIKYCEMFYKVCGEKIGVGILMFNRYQTSDGKRYTLTKKKLEEILDLLDKDVFRIDLCAVNKTSTGSQHQLSNEKAREFLEIVKEKGYEGKLFTSFGDGEQSGCGMLSSSISDMEEAGTRTIEQFNQSVELLKQAQEYQKMILLEE